ncbi:hypothetical protein [Marinoscillum sp. MHG1-6]|uniref:hypothetical protein n=1 Tax=Marinoscillum sp. MHG1-6 TaxID=2959627 RepID=UPI002157DB5F|nr:hypothetical protein [Marinoscillum sp. MHG1-6]
MNEERLLVSSVQLIQGHFELNVSETAQIKDFKKLFDLVHAEVKQLLNRDFSGLLNILYRIDVPEIKVKEILTHSDPELISYDLTEAIITRFREKAITRIRYSS